jgi:ATP-dependent Clp protease ATP-binding subunit ClpA
MSLYQTTDDIAHLIGTADDSNPGLLTQAIRQTPYGLLLLDEIEKANKDLLNIFLSVIDEAYFTDGGGKRVDCKNLVIIATSNAGADLLKQNSGQIAQKDVLNYLIEKGIFSPEFLNRFDGVVVYKYLQGESIYKVAKKMITSIQEKVSSLYNVSVVISDNTLQAIASQSYDANFGARDMERLIRKNIEDIVAKQILENKVQPGQQITI